MKKHKYIRKNKPSESNTIEHRLTKLEGNYNSLFIAFRDLKKSILSALENTNKDLKTLLDRKQEHEAVKTFLTHLLKVAGSFAAFTWAIVEIVSKLREWGILK